MPASVSLVIPVPVELVYSSVVCKKQRNHDDQNRSQKPRPGQSFQLTQVGLVIQVRAQLSKLGAGPGDDGGVVLWLGSPWGTTPPQRGGLCLDPGRKGCLQTQLITRLFVLFEVTEVNPGVWWGLGSDGSFYWMVSMDTLGTLA